MTTKCDRCHGDGRLLIYEYPKGAISRECPECKGNGWVEVKNGDTGR